MKWLDKNIWWLCAIAIIGPFWGWAVLVIVWVWPLAVWAYLMSFVDEKSLNLRMFVVAIAPLWGLYFLFLAGMVQRKEIPEWWIWLSDQTILNLL